MQQLKKSWLEKIFMLVVDEQYEANGQQIIATYDSIHISQFTINAVSPVGRYAIDYNGIPDAYATTKERRVAWNTTRKALRA